jgi:GNAT superfamily N-acetyltransferase
MNRMDRDEALARHRESLMSFTRLMGRSGEGAQVFERDGVVAAVSPAVPDRSVVNSVGYRDAEALGAALDDLAAAYENAGVTAWTVWVPEDDRDVAALLEGAGHHLDAEPVAMVAELAKLPDPEPAELDWDAKADPGDVALINDRAYGWPEGTFGGAMARFGEIDGLRLYQARVDGEPVSVLGTYDNGSDCEIYFVATEADHRGEGLARRLLHRALLDARDRGLTTSNLQSTKKGYPVYERLGYAPICTLQMWERRK